ncbi:MAG: efflux RND transporter permease subunit [Planctomycetes bacterium]|nr:efflux RND transporter permease subunit [Planctomycetota bacterium]
MESPASSPAPAPAPKATSPLLAFVTGRPVAVFMIMLAIGVFGFVSLTKLPVDLLPDISYPTLTVRTTWKGAAPEDVEERVSERIQETLSTLPHLVRATSVSRAETSDVVLDFEWGTPMTYAVQDVRDKLDTVFLPQGAERPLILRYDPNLDPILRIGVTLPAKKGTLEEKSAKAREKELVHLRWVAEERIERELESIPGLAAVQVRGGLEEEIRVRVDPFKMAAQNLDPALLAQRLAQENVNASGGLIREGSTEYLVRTLNEFRDVAEIGELSIVRRGDAVIRVKDVATIERTHAERQVVTRVDGREAVEIALYREAGANIVELADRVQERVFGTAAQKQWAKEQEEQGARGGGAMVGEHEQSDFLAWRLRDEAKLSVLSDQSTFIRSAVDDVKSAGLLGAFLSVVVIWFALRNLPSTSIIAISIPMSVIVTFAPMYLWGASLNIMSLGGLALGVGMVVDNSIVVLESITRCREEGDDLAAAAIRGTKEVMGAITGSTLTSVAVFAPIVFVHGIAGRIFGDQALTVVVSLLVSLAVAVLFIPMLASRRIFAGKRSEAPVEPPPKLREGLTFGEDRKTHDALVLAGRATLRTGGGIARFHAANLFILGRVLRVVLWPLHWVHDKVWGGIERGYPKLLAGALRNPWMVVFVAAGCFAFSLTRVSRLGLDLLPDVHQGEFTLHVGLPVGTPLENTDAVLTELEHRIGQLPEVQSTALVVGVEPDTLSRDIEGKHTARLTVRMHTEQITFEHEEHLLAVARDIVAGHPAVRSIEVTRATPFEIEAPIVIEVLGYDLEQLKTVAREVEARVARVPGLADVRTTIRPGHPEVRITFDRDKTLEYGLDLNAVSNLVRDQVLGNVSTRFNQGDQRIDVRVLGDEIELSSFQRVLDLVVNPAAATPVPLASVATAEVVEGPAEIRRIGNTRAILVTAATAGADLGGTADAVERELATVRPPDDVAVQLGGQKREMDEAQSSMRFALLLALFLVYAVMAAQFESLVQPLIILVTVPLAAVGVVFVNDALGIPLSVVVFIGLILLAGIVVNNAIVLVDRVNQTRARGLPVQEALLEAASTRLRPIYMTTATTVLGLLPMTGWLEWVPGIGALGSGQGAELRVPMAVTVCAGLTSSTLLTLIVIPCVYSLVYRRRDARERAAADGARA